MFKRPNFSRQFKRRPVCTCERNNQMKTLLVRFIAMAIFAISCFGDTITIFENPLSLVGNAYGFTAHEGKQEIFQHFTLSESATINQVGWCGQFSDGTKTTAQAQGGFNILLFRDDPNRLPDNSWAPRYITREGLPAEQALSAVRNQQAFAMGTGIGDPLLGGDIKEWAAAVADLTLDAGDYWISICANIAESGLFLWNHGLSDGEGHAVYGSVSALDHSSVLVSDCFPNQSTMSLSLGYRSVPDEGMTGWLILLGFVVIGFAYNEKMKRQTT